MTCTNCIALALEGCIANNRSFWVDTNCCATIDKPYAYRVSVGVTYLLALFVAFKHYLEPP